MKILLAVAASFLLSCQPPARETPPKAALSAPEGGAAPAPVADTESEPEVHFSPHGGCTEMVVRYVKAAESTIYVLAYSFTSGPIGEALVEKSKEPDPRIPTGKVTIFIILDKSDVNEREGLLPGMLAAHIPVLIDHKHAIAHNKVMVIDEKIVLTGSFNFTTAAEKSNAENCLALHDPKLAKAYLTNWTVHQAHSVPPPAQ